MKIDKIREYEIKIEKRNRIWKLIYRADNKINRDLCKNCKNYHDCNRIYPGVEECVNGLYDFFYKKETKNELLQGSTTD